MFSNGVARWAALAAAAWVALAPLAAGQPTTVGGPDGRPMQLGQLSFSGDQGGSSRQDNGQGCYDACKADASCKVRYQGASPAPGMMPWMATRATAHLRMLGTRPSGRAGLTLWLPVVKRVLHTCVLHTCARPALPGAQGWCHTPDEGEDLITCFPGGGAELTHACPGACALYSSLASPSPGEVPGGPSAGCMDMSGEARGAGAAVGSQWDVGCPSCHQLSCSATATLQPRRPSLPNPVQCRSAATHRWPTNFACTAAQQPRARTERRAWRRAAPHAWLSIWWGTSCSWLRARVHCVPMGSGLRQAPARTSCKGMLRARTACAGGRGPQERPAGAVPGLKPRGRQAGWQLLRHNHSGWHLLHPRAWQLRLAPAL